MNSKQLVKMTILGQNTTDITPVYGWVRENLTNELTADFGSVENFEDHYRFDMAHIFGGPALYEDEAIEKCKKEAAASSEEFTPEMLLEVELSDPDDQSKYIDVIKALNFYSKDRERFCYVQSVGSFEGNNGYFGIEDHLCYIAMYPDELKELYLKQAKWRARVAENMLSLGVDMIHISDDWGAQNSMMFKSDFLKEAIMPTHKLVANAVKKQGALLSLHSDGCIVEALDCIKDIGFDLVHPWQETAGMSYDIYLQKYQNVFAILGGICIQSILGFGDYPQLEREIRRVFSLLKGKRFIACTTHFVQDHCSIEELTFAYDLILKLAKGGKYKY